MKISTRSAPCSVNRRADAVEVAGSTASRPRRDSRRDSSRSSISGMRGNPPTRSNAERRTNMAWSPKIQPRRRARTLELAAIHLSVGPPRSNPQGQAPTHDGGVGERRAQLAQRGRIDHRVHVVHPQHIAGTARRARRELVAPTGTAAHQPGGRMNQIGRAVDGAAVDDDQLTVREVMGHAAQQGRYAGRLVQHRDHDADGDRCLRSRRPVGPVHHPCPLAHGLCQCGDAAAGVAQSSGPNERATGARWQ